MFVVWSAPVENCSFRNVGISDLVEQLNVSQEEAEYLLDHVIFSFWFIGEDHSKAEKKWTYDGDSVYSDFSFRDFLLANLLDGYFGYIKTGSKETTDRIRGIKALHEFIHFTNNRVTIKNKYVGQWKNQWKFDKC
jgi:hypothetical protein